MMKCKKFKHFSFYIYSNYTKRYETKRRSHEGTGVGVFGLTLWRKPENQG